MANLLDKNDRAIRAFLSGVVSGFNSETGITIRNNGELRQVIVNGENVGIVDVDSSMGNENPTGSGNYDINVMVRVKYPDATQPNQGVNDNRIALGELQEAVVSQLHQSDGTQDYSATARNITLAGNLLTSTGSADDQAANSDMGDYSCLEVKQSNITGGKNTQNPQDLNFYELCNFKVNVAGYGGYWN